jgi:drug/metabolite transporter (DMT)-like permease
LAFRRGCATVAALRRRTQFVNERFGVAVAVLSCSFGAGAAVATRYLVGGADPVTIAAIRFGGGALCLWPLALGLRVAWPRGRDRIAVAALGVLFFAVFFVFYNLALRYTTVARGTLALSMLPLMTMVAGAALGIEALTARKTAGVLIAIGGVAVALASGVADAPAGAWRGDLIMAAATLCMALYSVWSRPFVMRSSALGFLTAGMTAGATALVVASALSGGAAQIAAFGAGAWIASLYLAVAGGAPRLLPLGLRPAAREPDPRRQHHDGEPAGRRRGGGAAPGRAADGERACRAGCGVCGDLGRDERRGGNGADPVSVPSLLQAEAQNGAEPRSVE